MADVLESGHVVTDEDVDTARLIMELDRVLGRPSDPLTKQVAATPASRVRTVLSSHEGATDHSPGAGTNGHHVPASDDLIRTLTSAEGTAELAREVGEQLTVEIAPDERAKLVSTIEDVLRQRLTELVKRAQPRS